MDLGGNTRPCDPRWPFRTVPPDGATAAQVDGWNAMCVTARCLLIRCPDGRVYHTGQGSCTLPPGVPPVWGINTPEQLLALAPKNGAGEVIGMPEGVTRPEPTDYRRWIDGYNHVCVRLAGCTPVATEQALDSWLAGPWPHGIPGTPVGPCVCGHSAGPAPLGRYGPDGRAPTF